MKAIDTIIIGGGMITNDLILPSIYQLNRTGTVGAIDICALNSPPLLALAKSEELALAFPGLSFTPHPALASDPAKDHPSLYREVLAAQKPRQAAVVAMPDQLHYRVVMDALEANQHVLCVKPLVLRYVQAEEIRSVAYEKGLFVGVEYHKRFDRRSLLAKRRYSLGQFGEFVMGEAKMIEPYYYRSSNFQNWFTTENTDPFVYVGCHYVDLVYFITGLKPVELSVTGVKGRFPNGNEGYMWANGRVVYENGAILSVTDGLGYPDDGAGSNEQCLTMFCEGDRRSGIIKHNDQFRGVSHGYLDGIGAGGTSFNYVNPDFYQLVPWEGDGYKPIGYGFDSIAATIQMIHHMESNVSSLRDNESLEARRNEIIDADEKGIIATPANSSVNELVVEAARSSILADGNRIRIVYDDDPHIEPV